jgi:hypothetical protein
MKRLVNSADLDTVLAAVRDMCLPWQVQDAIRRLSATPPIREGVELVAEPEGTPDDGAGAVVP